MHTKRTTMPDVDGVAARLGEPSALPAVATQDPTAYITSGLAHTHGLLEQILASLLRQEKGADIWDGDTVVIPAGTSATSTTPMLAADPMRQSVVVVNQGANDCYLAPRPISTATGIRIPAGASRTVHAKGPIYVWSSAGTTVDWQTECSGQAVQTRQPF